MEFEIKSYRVGMIQTNCYFLINKDTSEVVIVDPGDEASRLAAEIEREGLKPAAVLLTHGHFDHITGVNDLVAKFPMPVYIHESEKDLLASEKSNPFSPVKGEFKLNVDNFIQGEPTLDIAGFSIKVYTTPGHTPGGVCFYLKDQDVLFSGDTLFCGSVGRTDFPGGSMSQLVRSVKDKLFELPESTKVYPGHEGATSIAFEKQYNPFIN
ncbi:MAG: MBL fold metallo-hydrolase [Eubacterium sp.]|nr:MBL fold metallo-hydrolase [Eubacterium sp.]